MMSKTKTNRYQDKEITEMDSVLIERLLRRDIIESRFTELFMEPKAGSILHSDGKSATNNDTLKITVARLRKGLKARELEIHALQEVINVKKRDSERLNDEIIGLNIENNLLQNKFEQLEKEHNQLVNRWLNKVQQDVEKLNANLQ